jgi:hypothetical protein
MKEGKADEYAERVLGLDRAGVVKTWEELQAGQTPPGWPPGRLLEYLLLRGFQLEGARVKWPFQVYYGFSVEQLDGVVHCGERTWLLECKHQWEPVDAQPLFKLKWQLVRRPGVVGALFSTGSFTKSAKALAHLLPPANVLLWEGKEIDLALRHGKLVAGMRKKLEFAAERGFSDLELFTLEDYE